MAETMVRMGEYAASAWREDILVSIGLGSCIGFALVDRRRGVAGLAHIMLPDSSSTTPSGAPNRYADQAIPALLADVIALGAQRISLEAVLVGGATMFAMGGNNLDIGARNEASTRAILERMGIPIHAAETGGSKGRTIRVHLDGPQVTCREAGTSDVPLLTSERRSRAA